jgi:hypothetical protein
MFTVGLEDFSEEEGVTDGVGPRFNFVGCSGCHAQPAVGGTSPAQNPLFRVTGDLKFTGNVMPSFITPNRPIREARFQFNPDGSRDGGVHALFVITGHPEAAGCSIRQEEFETQIRNRNIVFRIPRRSSAPDWSRTSRTARSWRISTPTRQPSEISASAGV